MRILIVGTGGREHALAWSLSRSPRVSSLVFAPGNAGMASMGQCHPVGDGDLPGLVALAEDCKVDFVVVGPEAPLVGGLADLLRARGIPVLGPGRHGARLEGSKSYAKSIMAARGIPTAESQAFVRSDEALAYLDRVGAPVVVKADGLAAGKGVTVCEDAAGARQAIREALEGDRFGPAGRRILIEERLSGQELSVLAFCDGKTVLAMQPAQDFKRAYDGDSGPNTGGMGSHSPVAACSPALLDGVIDHIIEPVAAALAEEGEPYVGVIYAGLMLTPEGPKVLEFNCRFGDPETQALLPRLESDLVQVLSACVEGSLAGVRLAWRSQVCVSVVATSAGYPGSYDTGFPVGGLAEAAQEEGCLVFHAGTRLGDDGGVVTSGGRVLAVSALGRDHTEARQRAYRGMSAISFEGIRFRTDIAAGVEDGRAGARP